MRFSAKAENRGVVVTEAGSYVRRIDFFITQLKAQGPSRFCNESKEAEGGSTMVMSRLLETVDKMEMLDDAFDVNLLLLLLLDYFDA